MPILLNQAKLSVKDENGNYIGINTIAERTTAEQIEDINSAANTKIVEMQNIRNEMNTAAQAYVNQMYSGSQPGFPEYYAKVQDISGKISDLNSELNAVESKTFEEIEYKAESTGKGRWKVTSDTVTSDTVKFVPSQSGSVFAMGPIEVEPGDIVHITFYPAAGESIILANYDESNGTYTRTYSESPGEGKDPDKHYTIQAGTNCVLLNKLGGRDVYCNKIIRKIDKTLTKEDFVADAKAVGDKIDTLEDTINNEIEDKISTLNGTINDAIEDKINTLKNAMNGIESATLIEVPNKLPSSNNKGRWTISGETVSYVADTATTSYVYAIDPVEVSPGEKVHISFNPASGISVIFAKYENDIYTLKDSESPGLGNNPDKAYIIKEDVNRILLTKFRDTDAYCNFYTLKVDKTLSMENVPADAKTVSEAIAQASNDMEYIKVNSAALWEKGSYSRIGKVEYSASNPRLRSPKFEPGVLKSFKIEGLNANEYEIGIVRWDAQDSYSYRGSSSWTTSGTYNFVDDEFDFSDYKDYRFGLILRNKSNTEFTPEDAGSEITLEIDRAYLMKLIDERISALKEKAKELETKVNELPVQRVSSSSFWRQGSREQTENFSLTRISTAWFNPGTVLSMECAKDENEVYKYEAALYIKDGDVVKAYKSNGWQPTSGASPIFVTSFDFSDVTDYQILVMLRNKADPTASITPDEGINVTFGMSHQKLTNFYIDELRKEINNNTVVTLQPWGVSNVLARAKHVLDIKWTPLEGLQVPMPGSGAFIGGTTYTGLPYSTTRKIGTVVGINVSFYTFMSALQNPRSVMYTKVIRLANARAYYGTSCNGLINYAYGKKEYMLSDIQLEEYGKETSPVATEVGDWLFSQDESHQMLITKVEKDSYGRITFVTYSHSTMTVSIPTVATTRMSYKQYVNSVINSLKYVTYKNPNINQVDYTPIPFVKGYDDEVLEKVEYPDIMPEYGDKSVVLAGGSNRASVYDENGNLKPFTAGESNRAFMINVINKDGYNRIDIIHDGTVIETKTDIQDFKMNPDAPGEYEIKIYHTDTEKTSSCFFTVVDYHCEWNKANKILTFSSQNSTPYFVWLYTDSNYYMRGRPLTQEEIVNGSADLTDLSNKWGEGYKNARIQFKTPNGDATWFSYWNNIWIQNADEYWANPENN